MIELTAQITPIIAISGTLEKTASNPTYAGPYEVTPKVYSAVVLATDGKSMSDDVTVYKIPQYETINIYGGNTLIIGDDYPN